MNKKNIFLYIAAFMFLSSLPLTAQDFTSVVKGRILDAADGKPVIGANVYISGTLWGTSSDLKGNYNIKGLPAGNHELVISMIGYVAETKPMILRDNATLKMDISLYEKVYEYGVVEVAAERPDEWKKNLIDFKKLFLGSSQFARECDIENEVMIDFTKTDKGILVASSREPLLIKNKALGFEINCIIKKFNYDEVNQRCQYKISPTFKEMESANEEIKESWQRNRKIAYEGALHHFLKTLKADSLFERGYKVQICESPMWKEFRVSNPIISNDSLLSAGLFPNEHILNFQNYLRITYKNPYLRKNEISYLRLPYGRVNIDEFGYLEDDMGIEVLGEWTTKGIADMLPKYYFLQL